MLGLRPSVVVLPKETASATDTLLRAHRALDGSTLECQLVPLSPGYSLRGPLYQMCRLLCETPVLS